MQTLDTFVGIKPFDVLRLHKDYVDVFGEDDVDDDLGVDSSEANGGLALKSVARLTFEPDRLAALANATQAAIIRVFRDQPKGTIHVIDAGMGLGYLGVAALSLNSRLGGRVHFTGLELNPLVHAHSHAIFEMYGVSRDSYDLIKADATTFDRVPSGTRVLVAEHLAPGLFTREPMLDVCRNLVPQLAPGYFLVPRGVGVYGRVLAKNEGAPDNTIDRAQVLLSKVVAAAVESRFALRRSEKFLCFDEDQWGKVVPDFGMILPETHIANLDFSRDASSSCDGGVNLSFGGVAQQSGEGVVELRIVPWLNFDGEFDVQKALLGPRRFYLSFDGGVAVTGTNLNQWKPVLQNLDVDQAMLNARGPRHARFQEIVSGDRYAVKGTFQKGRTYGVSLKGSINRFTVEDAEVVEL